MPVSIKKVMIAWNRNGGVELFPWPDTQRRSRKYQLTSGACNADVHDWNEVQRQHFVLSTAMGLIVNDGVDPVAVHKAFWGIEEYQNALPPDTSPPPGEKSN
jgi:hypothetical protein